VDELEHGASGPNDQQRLVAGMLDRDNLLDLIRTFTLFSTNDKGQAIKMVGRYQQFRAVKLAVKRLLEGKSPRERSGIIWHTQGSGKSLTMMFMVREMYRHAKLSNWKVVFVTDRTQLEDQLTETSQSIGFTVKVADSIAKLKELLRADTSDLIMAMIHKFREADLTETFPKLNTSPNILVMTDEAHRSQYKLLGANLDKGIPKAAKIGYTGTPIDKTEQVFGDYIDKYTMRQSIEDGVTLEIIYEGRTHNAEVADQGAMDTAFEDVFSEYNLQQRLDILGYGSRDAYLEAEPTIRPRRGHGRALSDACVSKRIQGSGGRDVTRGGGAVQEAHRRRARSGDCEVGEGQPDQAGPRSTQEDADRRHHFRRPQRPAPLKGVCRQIQTRSEHQELQVVVRRRGGRRQRRCRNPDRQQHAIDWVRCPG